MSTIARPPVPHFNQKAELFSYLRKNCNKIIAEKKSFPIKSDNFEFGYSVAKQIIKTFGQKAANTEEAETPQEVEGELNVDVVANVSGWCDSYMDVMIKDNWNKSINDIGASGQKIMYHLKNHDYSTDAIIAKDASIYAKMLDLSMFNITSDIKKAQALMMTSTLVEEYDPKCFMLYRDKQIKQHSIGLQYVKIYLCMDSEEAEDSQYKDNWDKYYPQVINKDKADSRGFFWAVVEAKILEVSAVLYGANELTPVESMNSDDTKSEPPAGTHSQPSETGKNAIDWDKMATKILSIN